jgi:hypothetical protein
VRYPYVSERIKANPKITREELMQETGAGSLQVAAWMQRYAAEQHFSKHPDKPFEGRYNGSKPTPKRAPKPRKETNGG